MKKHTTHARTPQIRQAALKSFKLAYHQHGGHCIEINPSAPIDSVIFSLSIKATSDIEAFNAFVDEGLRRSHFPKATADRYKSLIRKNVASIRIS